MAERYPGLRHVMLSEITRGQYSHIRNDQSLRSGGDTATGQQVGPMLCWVSRIAGTQIASRLRSSDGASPLINYFHRIAGAETGFAELVAVA